MFSTVNKLILRYKIFVEGLFLASALDKTCHSFHNIYCELKIEKYNVYCIPIGADSFWKKRNIKELILMFMAISASFFSALILRF